MPRNVLNVILREFYSSDPHAHTSRRKLLEAELLPLFRSRYPGRSFGFPLLRIWWFRPATAVLLSLALFVVACNLPTSYEMTLGTELFYQLEGNNAPAEVINEMADQVNDVVRLLEAQPSVSDASAISAQVKDYYFDLRVYIWGRELTGNELDAILRENFPALERGSVEIKDISYHFDLNLATKVLFIWKWEEPSDERLSEARQKIENAQYQRTSSKDTTQTNILIIRTDDSIKED
jgi:hypothetical protein